MANASVERFMELLRSRHQAVAEQLDSAQAALEDRAGIFKGDSPMVDVLFTVNRVKAEVATAISDDFQAVEMSGGVAGNDTALPSYGVAAVGRLDALGPQSQQIDSDLTARVASALGVPDVGADRATEHDETMRDISGVSVAVDGMKKLQRLSAEAIVGYIAVSSKNPALLENLEDGDLEVLAQIGRDVAAEMTGAVLPPETEWQNSVDTASASFSEGLQAVVVRDHGVAG